MINVSKFTGQKNKDMAKATKKKESAYQGIKTSDVLSVKNFYKRGFIKGIAGYYKKATFVDHQVNCIDSVAMFYQILKNIESIGGTRVSLKIKQDDKIDYAEFHIERLLPEELREPTMEAQLQDLSGSISKYFLIELQMDAYSIAPELNDKVLELRNQRNELRKAIQLKIIELNSPEKFKSISL
jgi:hypothetical protein